MSGANFNWCWISTVRCKVYNIHHQNYELYPKEGPIWLVLYVAPLTLKEEVLVSSKLIRCRDFSFSSCDLGSIIVSLFVYLLLRNPVWRKMENKLGMWIWWGLERCVFQLCWDSDWSQSVVENVQKLPLNEENMCKNQICWLVKRPLFTLWLKDFNSDISHWNLVEV